MNTILKAITHLSSLWALSNIRPLVKTSPATNYVARAYSALHNTDVVLKILAHTTQEPKALTLFNGSGCVKLLEYDAEYHGLLLENITPGTSLSALFPKDDARALEITAALIKKMQAAASDEHGTEFPTVQQWLEILRTERSKAIPQRMLDKAYNLSKELLEEPYESRILHGDLHHENILQCSAGNPSTAEWKVIDPKGVIGPLEFEVIRFMMNPIPDLLEQATLQKITARRIEQLQTLFGFEKERLMKWLFVQAVLSACWAYHDNNTAFFNYFLTFAKVIEKIE